MSDIIEKDILENTDQHNSNIAEDETAKERTEAFLPYQFKTVFGKTVTLYGKNFTKDRAMVRYATSGYIGYALLNPNLTDPPGLMETVDKLIENEFTFDEDGNEIDSILLPDDAIDLSGELKGVIVQDLRAYGKGLTWMLNPEGSFIINSGDIQKAVECLLKFVKVIRHIYKKGYALTKLDGHQLFFCEEYGSFRFLFDGVDLVDTNTDELDDNVKTVLQNTVSAVIMYSLTGVWPDFDHIETLLSSIELKNDSSELYIEKNTDRVLGTDSQLAVWHALPMQLRTALIRTCLSETPQPLTLDEWEDVLIFAVAETEECAFCGKTVFKNADACLYCSHTTSKADLFTKWQIRNSQCSYCVRISFGRGTVIAGQILGIKQKSIEFMKLQYNLKENALGLRNLSDLTWIVRDNSGTDCEEICPGAIMRVKSGLVVSFKEIPDITMTFIGFEAE